MALSGELRLKARRSTRQIQSKFKHAADFGIERNYNSANARAFQDALQAHVSDSFTQAISGSYRGRAATIFYNPESGLGVIRNSSGDFVSGWRFSEGQVENLLRSGSIGGG